MERNTIREYHRWLSAPALPGDLLWELEAIARDDAAIRDRFCRELEFGTGGLRGVLGAGTNRMNVILWARQPRACRTI